MKTIQNTVATTLAATLATTLLSSSMLLASPELNAKLKSISAIETGHNDNAIGLKGERSRYQLSRAVWRQHYGRKTDNRKNPKQATQLAILHITWLQNQYIKSNERKPSAAQLYAMWQLGFEGFKRHHMLISSCSNRVQERCERFANIYTEEIR